MIVHNLSEENSILNQFIAELRDVSVQKDSMRFRRNIERIGEILSYEMSKTLEFSSKKITTPLAEMEVKTHDNNIVLCSVLRAGVPLHNGLLNYFDAAENAFISAYRHHKENPETFEIVVEYLACPDLNNKTLILADPMLATGQSLVATYKALQPFGTAKNLHIFAVIGAKVGVEYLEKHLPKDAHLWIATVDDKLNEKGYIVPGLGDAGDLAFGEKLQQ